MSDYVRIETTNPRTGRSGLLIVHRETLKRMAAGKWEWKDEDSIWKPKA